MLVQLDNKDHLANKEALDPQVHKDPKEMLVHVVQLVLGVTLVHVETQVHLVPLVIQEHLDYLEM